MKTILVTGGNRGIGKEICRQLAADGHHVLLGSRDFTKGKAAAAEMSGKVEVVKLDVGDEESRLELAKQLTQLDVLINNAGILPGNKGADAVTMEEVRQVLEINYFGVWSLIQNLLPQLRQASEGRIINMSSSMGAHAGLASGRHASYRVSKANLNDLTILLAADLASEGIKVNAMDPGWVRTDMGGAGASRSVEQGADTAVWLATTPVLPNGKFWRDRKQIAW